jgi:hypothetical protein
LQPAKYLAKFLEFTYLGIKVKSSTSTSIPGVLELFTTRQIVDSAARVNVYVTSDHVEVDKSLT